jgi:hypothetical protein
VRLELLTPPVLVCVDRMPALLLARRGDRRYVQVSRGAGLNHLCWVDAAVVRPAGEASPVEAELPATRFGLPRAER